jgi:membrane-associated phospholipid phosphatase
VRQRLASRLPRTPRSIALTVWAVAFAAFCLTQGLPLDRGTQTFWILLALFAVNLGRPWRAQLRILLDWLPFVGFLYLYDYTRGLADRLGRPIQVNLPIDFDRWLFHGTVPTVWLQQHFFDPSRVHWYDIVVSLVYFSHFFVVWIVAAVLYARSRAEWARWARRLLLLSYAGLVTFMLFPSAPPWYAAQVGAIPDVQRIAQRGWDALDLRIAGDIISRAQGGVNDFAAVPSLHAAFTAMLTVFVWTRLHRVGRTLMVIYTLAMALSVVYAGEHYVFDVLVGYAYVAAVVVLANWWVKRRERRKLLRASAGVVDITESEDARNAASADAP